MGFIHKPQRVWVRRALFQVHLWVGIILGLYLIVIGITGSILVLQDEIATLSYPNPATSSTLSRSPGMAYWMLPSCIAATASPGN